jgi:DNA-binding NtrC family response regulator
MPTNAAVCLLLEDEPLISMDLEMTLGAAGVDVTSVMSCEEANDWLEICRPDVVVVDIELRDGCSDKVVQRLVEDNIPFIVHSGDHPSMHSVVAAKLKQLEVAAASAKSGPTIAEEPRSVESFSCDVHV